MVSSSLRAVASPSGSSGSQQQAKPGCAPLGMSVLAAAGRSIGLAARFACSTKPKLRCGRPSAPPKQCYTFARCARICTRVAASQPRAAAVETPTRDTIKAAHSAFYAPEGVNFDDLTLNTAVVHALQQAGFVRPSTVQV